jgi:hypothetical protein
MQARVIEEKGIWVMGRSIRIGGLYPKASRDGGIQGFYGGRLVNGLEIMVRSRPPHPNPLPGGEGIRMKSSSVCVIYMAVDFLFPLSPRERVRVRDLFNFVNPIIPRSAEPTNRAES